VNIRTIIEELYELFESKLKARTVQYHLVIDDNIPETIYIDKTRYMQVFLNVMSNAIKYTFEGFIKVSVGYDEDKDCLATCIRDTGIGIKEEDVPKLFRLFGK
jgi:signal transduction histidine kinase